MWALQVAAVHAMPGSAFRADCMSVLQSFQRGRRWVSASGCRCARIWNISCSAGADSTDVDCCGCQRTSDVDIGELLLSNAAPLSATDCMANAEAVRLAELAAGATRVPKGVRARIEDVAAQVSMLAKWIG